MKKSSRQNTAENHTPGIPRNLALEKCIRTYTIKVQPSLYHMLKQCTPEQVRRILIEKLHEVSVEHEKEE